MEAPGEYAIDRPRHSGVGGRRPQRRATYQHFKASISFPGVSRHLRIRDVCWRTATSASSRRRAWSSSVAGEVIVKLLCWACGVAQVEVERELRIGRCLRLGVWAGARWVWGDSVFKAAFNWRPGLTNVCLSSRKGSGGLVFAMTSE